MKASTAYRFSGICMLIGGLGAIIAHGLHPERPEEIAQLAHYAQVTAPVHLLLYFASLLVLIGFPAVFLRQRGRMGIVGAISLVIIIFGFAVGDMMHCVLEAIVVPGLAATHPTDALTILQGIEGEYEPITTVATVISLALIIAYPLFAILTLRARIFPRWTAFLMFGVMGVLLLTMLPFVPAEVNDHTGVLFYMPFVAFGYILAREKPEALNVEEGVGVVTPVMSAL